MGTPDFAAAPLQALCDSRHKIISVYTQPPRPKGRGHKVQKSPVHTLAENRNIPVYTPESLKHSAVQKEFAAQQIDVAIIAAYGLILPQTILETPKHGCLNIHASLLPRWRGASPIQQAIWAGDKKSGITIMQMDKGLDTGDIIVQSEIMLDKNTTAQKLHDHLADMGAQLTLEVLDQLSQGKKLNATKQDKTLATYAHLLKKSDGNIDWTQNATQIDRQIRALTPWPSVWAILQNKNFKITETSLPDNGNPKYENAETGTILNKSGLIQCGQNTTLKINTLQPQGKKPMDFGSAINGGYLDPEKFFS